MNGAQKFLHILSWIPLLIIKLVLVVLGLVVVPVALLLKVDMQTLPVWGNREGVLGFWKGSQFWWYAIRNPVNNLRYVFAEVDDYHEESDWGLVEPMEAPQMININRRSAYSWRWSGWQAGYRKIWLSDNKHYSEIWFGWKFSDVPGLGFTSQVRLKRKIGT